MSRFRKIDPRVWNDEKFRRFNDRGKLAFLFVLTHPGMTALGAMRASVAGLAAELGWPEKIFRNALKPAVEEHMVDVNEEALFIGLPKFLRYNEPEGPNSVKKAWPAALDLIPECDEKNRLVVRCRSYLDDKTQDFKDAIGDAIWDAFKMPSEMPCHIQEQEQEQEQEQDDGRKSSPNSFSPIVEKTIRRLNELSGKHYRPNSKNITKNLRAQLKEGFTETDFLLVVDDRWRLWKNKPDMRQHFNPETLFRPANFERYLTEAKYANGRGGEQMRGGFVG